MFAGIAAEEIFKQVSVAEEGVKICTGYAGYCFVEHGVDVIGTALAGFYTYTPAFKKR